MIRAAVHGDIPRLVELGALMHGESKYRAQTFDRDKVGRLLASLIAGDGVVFVAERGGLVVGGMAGGVAPNWFNDDLLGFEYALFVAPAARHGITAMKLVSAFTNWCALRGAKRLRVGITTGVQVENTAALYRALGYVDDGIFLSKEL